MIVCMCVERVRVQCKLNRMSTCLCPFTEVPLPQVTVCGARCTGHEMVVFIELAPPTPKVEFLASMMEEYSCQFQVHSCYGISFLKSKFGKCAKWSLFSYPVTNPVCYLSVFHTFIGTLQLDIAYSCTTQKATHMKLNFGSYIYCCK